MSLHKHCLLLLSVALLIAVMRPHGVAANQPDKQTEKSQASKKKKKEGERVKDTSAQLRPFVPEPVAPPPSPPPANGSLFQASAPGNNLLGDFKASNVGDLVFIDVIEESAASVSSNAKRARDSGALTGVVGGAVSTVPAPGAAVAAGVLGALGTRKFEGKGETGRRSSLKSRVAARVVEVLPNGDLRIEAQKMVKINKEDELLTLSGIVRRRDVSAENSVPTTEVGDLRVMLNGKGVASADNAPGWLFRLFEKISPF
jgi:flagellar L-ring protein precursor FlgH